MRITNGMIADSTMRNINKAANRLADANAAVSSNQKIQKASDDPVVAARAVTYRSYVSQIKQYQDNVKAADGWQSTTDSALSQLSDIITTAKTLTNQAASTGTLSDSDLSDIKARIETLQNEALTIMNTSYNGKYIFGGYSTTEEPYASSTTSIGEMTTYKGKYLNLCGAVSADVSDADILSFYNSNTSLAYDSVNDAAAKALKTYNSAQAAADANPTDTTLAAKAASAKATSDTLAAAVSSYGGATSLSDAISSAKAEYDTAKAAYSTAKSDYDGAKAAADADPTDTTLADAATAAKSILDASETAMSTAKNTLEVLNAASNSNDQNINYNIGFNSEVTVNIEGQDVTGEGTGNLFDTFSKLLLALDGATSYKSVVVESGTAAVKTNTLNISDLIDEFSSALEQVTVAQASLGARRNVVSSASDNLGDAYTAYKSYMTDNENIDTAEAATELASAEYTYEASLAVGAKVISKTLIDYIG